jgi:hypothetical protein
MLGTCNPQPALFYQITLEQFVPDAETADVDQHRPHSALYAPLHADMGCPSIPPEQLLLVGWLLNLKRLAPLLPAPV